MVTTMDEDLFLLIEALLVKRVLQKSHLPGELVSKINAIRAARGKPALD